MKLVSEAEMREACRIHKDTLEADEEAPWGYTIFDSNIIYIRRVTKKFPKNMQLHAFWHEYFHMILDRAHRERLARDETLVDELGSLQLQALHSMKF